LVRGYVDSNDVCHVGKLIVHPGYQNQGIGKALMYEIEKYFPACCKLVLFTGEETPNTLHLYEKVGYHIVSKEKDGRSFYDFYGKGYNSLIFYCQIMFLKIFL
jgi:ribosomal protein S18 acetylase RimI-like enzyme